MQPHSEPYSAAASSSNADITWHTANTAKTHQALSLFANVRANVHAAPAAAATTRHSTRRGSAPAVGHAHTPRAVSHTGSTVRPEPRRGSNSVSPTRDDVAPAPLIYTDAEVASMSPVQLRRQLRVASAVTQRLHRRTGQLEREVETWRGKCGEHGEIGVETRGDAAPRAVRVAEQRAEALQAQVRQLTHDKEALLRQMETAESANCAEGVPAASSHSHLERSTARSVGGTAVEDSPGVVAAAVQSEDGGEVTLLRDTVRQLQRRLDLSEERVRRATQVQLDALLHHRGTTASPPPPPTLAMVNAEVQRLFQLMQEQLQANAAQQQAERARMNELFYQLERQRGML